MPAPGLNYRLSDILCAIGIPQLRRLDELLAARERVAAGYAERLARAAVVLPEADEGDRHGWQAYVIQLDRRDEVMAAPARPGHPVPDRHVRAAPALRLPRPGRVPRRRPGLRAGARAAVPLAAHRLGSRPGRGALTMVVSDC